MLYYYVVYPLTHVDISELQSKSMTFIKHISNHRRTSVQKHLSNQCQTSIEPLSNVYRTTFNPNYTHWVPRNLNLNLLIEIFSYF